MVSLNGRKEKVISLIKVWTDDCTSIDQAEKGDSQ